MSPLGTFAILGGALSLMAYLRRPARPALVTYRLWGSLFSWAFLWFATGSSFAARGMSDLVYHMIGHVIVMFLVPIGLILSGTAREWWWILPVSSRRRAQRWWYVGRKWRIPRAIAHPITAALFLNVVMVTAHLPATFDWVMATPSRMGWLMEPAFLLSGVCFFHFLIPAPPFKNTERLRLQLAMVLSTMAEMLAMAMAMSIFTSTSWYRVMTKATSAMSGMANESVGQALHQQQIAAAILWICGDFWAVPCIILIVRRAIQRDGSILSSIERQSRLFSSSGAVE